MCFVLCFVFGLFLCTMSLSLSLQCLLGMACEKFTIVAADQTQLQSINVMKNDAQKLFELSDRIVMGVNGELGDMAQFTHFIQQNVELYRMRNRYDLSTRAAVHFTRKNISDAIATANPYTVNLVVAGWDPPCGGQLYSIDFLGSCVQLPCVAHGFGGMLCTSIFDTFYRPNLSEEAAYELLMLGVSEIQKRLFMNLTNFQVKLVDCDGVRDLPTIAAPAILSSTA